MLRKWTTVSTSLQLAAAGNGGPHKTVRMHRIGLFELRDPFRDAGSNR